MEKRIKDDSLYAEYLKQHLGESLAWAVAEIVEIRPKDPIEYLAQWLYHSKGMNPQGASAFSRASSSTNSTNNRSVQSTPTSRMSHHINIKTSTGNEQTIEAKAAPMMIKTHISSTHIIKRTVDDDDDFIDEDITNISTHNSAMAHVHIDFNRIKDDLFDNDDIL